MIDLSALTTAIAARKSRITSFVRRKWRRGKARARASFGSLKEYLTQKRAASSAVGLLLVALLAWSVASNSIELAAVILLLIGLLLRMLGKSDFSTELISIAITVLLIDRMNDRRAIEQEKKALILQMGSPENAFAVEATRILRVRGWIEDGSLREAYLMGANLQGAHLGVADLQGAILLGADLRGANLKSANLQGAELWGANLQEANLWGANLHGVTLGGANLHGANLRDANLQEANLRDANLQKANLMEANLQEAILRDANLQEAILWGANLQRGNLRGADLSAAHNLEMATLTGAKADSETRWPEGFQVPDTVEIVAD
jgi:uncharacterized protein YjbI with pentapeptide repeats